MRHRYAVQNWLQASFRLAQVVGHHAARSGDAVRAELSTGEVVATVSNDALRAGGAFDILARLVGRRSSSYVVVAVILLTTSVELGLLVLIGVPLLTLSLSFVIKPLQERQREQREEVGLLTALGADTAAGLRVLRGVGGEQAFFDRYQQRSESVRVAGVRVAAPQSTLDAAQVLLPGLFVVLVTWVGAHLAASGEITAGELVAFYGYAGFLVIPLRTSAEAVEKFTRAHRRRPPDAARARRRARASTIPRRPAARAAAGRAARRPATRASSIEPGSSDLPRLGLARRDERARRPARPPRRRLRRDARRHPARPAAARGRAPADPRQRARPAHLLRARSAASSTRGGGRATTRSPTAIEVAAAEDVLVALPAGLDEIVDERGRSFSGGQRQRLVLVRALLAERRDPRARRADERRRRAHRGADRAPAPRLPRRPHDGRRRRRARSCSTRPTRSCSSPTGACRRRARTASCSARAPRLPRRRHPGRGPA